MLGKGLVRLLADFFVLPDLLLLLASSLEVLRPLFQDIAAGFEGLVGSDRLHCWDFDDVFFEVNRRLWGYLLILSDQLLASFFFLAFGLLAGQRILASIGEFMEIELFVDDLPSEDQIVLVSELLIDEFQLLIVGLSDLVGLPVVKFLEEVFLNLSCDSVGICKQVQVILKQFLLYLGLIFQQSQLLTGQYHILCQVFPVSLSAQDLLFGVLRALLELALGVTLEILESFLSRLEHTNGQITMSTEHVKQFSLFGLFQLQIGLFWWIFTYVFQLSLLSLLLLVPYTLDGVQLFKFLLL